MKRRERIFNTQKKESYKSFVERTGWLGDWEDAEKYVKEILH